MKDGKKNVAPPDGTIEESIAAKSGAVGNAETCVGVTAADSAADSPAAVGDMAADEEISADGNSTTEDGQTAVAEDGKSPDGQMKNAQPPKKKHRWVLNVLLIVVIAIGIYSLFGISDGITEGEGLSFGEVLSNIELSGALLLLAVIVCIMIVDCLKFCVVNKAVIGKVRPLVAMKTSFLGKFYDGVTPFSTGGQPMQIYYMTTKGVSGADSSAVVLIRYFGSIFAFTVIGAVFMILGVSLGYIDNVEVGKTLLMVCGWVGLAVNLILPIFIAFFVCMPRLAHKLTGWFINLGVKLHIVKHKYRVMAKALKIVDNFTKSFKIIVKRPVCLVLFLVCCFVENFLTFSVPYFVMNAIGCDMDGAFFIVMTLNIFSTFGVSFIPTPGNSGVIEGMSMLAFSMFAGNSGAWAVLFWRFSVYYIYIFIGVAITIADLIIKNIKGKKSAQAVKNE